MRTQVTGKERWVINNVDPMTIATVKTLAASKKQSIAYTLDLAVEYFSRKVIFGKSKPLQWSMPDDF